jgi:hypothetical protein
MDIRKVTSFKPLENSNGRKLIQDNIGHQYYYHHSRKIKGASSIEYFRCLDVIRCRSMLISKNGTLFNQPSHTRHPLPKQHVPPAETVLPKEEEMNLESAPQDVSSGNPQPPLESMESSSEDVPAVPPRAKLHIQIIIKRVLNKN